MRNLFEVGEQVILVSNNRPECSGDYVVGKVVPDKSVSCMLSCHQATARWSTNRTARVHLGELDAFACKAVYIGRANFLLPVAAKFSIAEIISHDENNVRSFGLALFFGIAATAQ